MSVSPTRVELHQELLTAHCLGFFTDDTSVHGQAFQTLEHSVIRRMHPTHIPRPTPAVGAQLIQTAVIPDAKSHVGIDAWSAGSPQCGPGLQTSGIFGSDGADCSATLGGLTSQRLGKFVGDVCIKRRHDRFGWTVARHRDRLVTHRQALICTLYEGGAGRLWVTVDLSSFNAQSARDMSLVAMVVGVLGVLLVLKFVSSVVSKLLLGAVFAGVIWLGFNQRDALSACIAEIQTRVEQGDTSDITCSFFGRDVSVEIPFQQ